MTVIVQQPTDSNGNPQPMVYDSDTGKVIVDSNGFIVSGGQKLVNIPSKADYVSTAKTQTAGIQEAIAYKLSEGGGTIIIKNGVYTVSAPIQWSNQEYAIQIIGENTITGFAVPGSYYPAVSLTPTSAFPVSSYMFEVNKGEVVKDQQTFSIKNLSINCSPNNGTATGIAGALYIENAYKVEISNCRIVNSSTNGILYISSNGTAGDTLHVVNCLFASNNGYDINSACPLAYFLHNHHYNSGNSSALLTSGAYYLSQDSTAYINGAILDTLNGAGIITNIPAGTLIIDDVYTFSSIPGPFIEGTVQQLYISNSEVPSAYSFNIGISSESTIISNCILTNAATSTTGLDYYIYNSHYPSYTGISNCIFQPNSNGLTPSENYIEFTGEDTAIIQVSNILGLPFPSTPSVPASGTAQENTNPYPVDVYIYGGDVTEIQITRNGTAYTVLSVSTAIAMSGQAYKLNPGDSITITYSTAPSWEWLSD